MRSENRLLWEMNILQKIGCIATFIKTVRRNILNKKFEPEVSILPKFIEKNSICFDIGAGEGRYTLVMSRLASKGKIFSFEPGTYSMTTLSWIVKFYRLKNITLVKKALADKNGVDTLLIPIKKNNKVGYGLAHLGFSSPLGHIKAYLEEKIDLITLDSFCQEIQAPKVDFIKCDIEGAEFLAFKGGERTINKYLPTVLCEICPPCLKQFNSSPNQVDSFFIGKGYRMYIFKDKELEKVETFKGKGNYFFVHPEKVKL